MAESVSVRCPTCRREHTYAPPSYPCSCGAPVSLPLLSGGVPVQVQHRTWAGSWVPVRCGSCGKLDEWPQPEFGCVCGAIVRVPVASPGPPPTAAAEPTGPTAPHGGRGSGGGPARPAAPRGPADRTPDGSGSGSGTGRGSEPPRATREAAAARPSPARPTGPPARRPAFRPVTIRTAQDAKTAAAQYLRWLGFTEVRIAGNRPASGVDLRGPEVVAHVDPTTTPTTLRDIETLWLNGLNESATAVCFSLAGYSHDARNRADELALPLFVLDLTGTPQPVNDPADALIRTVA
ncbi:hypothetical protein LHJ74_30200 [Streptomyces sp. N2-109]|uniref:Restriction endonuclease type IV Mrr domain-containing protein n=1 Tax=Streptomyces gossypii TaxID=2883101 RepID=A0ABT2K2B8_9ACTN|nr:hypothetical protein [Streptomyces gossypii]MCT2594131.1 hypothetical protein [Streptomyces gossypii]